MTRLRTLAVLVALMTAAVGRPALAADDADEKKDTTETKDADEKKDTTETKDADETKEASKSKDADEPKKDDDTGHGFQFGLRVGFVFGYKTVFRYDSSPFCRSYDNSRTLSDQQKVCGFLAPPGIELALSFALFDGFEPYVFGRFGFSMEKETDTDPLLLFGVGARIYTTSDANFKFFIEPAIAIETEGGAGNPIYALSNPDYKTDMIFHGAAGPQYDFSKLVGIYLGAGLDVGVLRAISAALSINIGAQLRIP